MYNEHEAQAQVNHDEKGVRFGAIITSFVEHYLFQELTHYRKESVVPQTPWNVCKKEEHNNEEEIWRLYVPGTHSGRCQIKSIYSHCVLPYCMSLTKYIYSGFAVCCDCFSLVSFMSCLHISVKIINSSACVFPPPPFCCAADWLLLAVVKELLRALKKASCSLGVE